MIDHGHQTEMLENVQFENLVNLIEQLSVLNLGRLPGTQLNEELNLENLFFIGTQKEFILNNKLINLDWHFDQMKGVEFV